MVENIIKQMTLKEKVGQLNQHLYESGRPL